MTDALTPNDADMRLRHPTRGYVVCGAKLRQQREPDDDRPDYCLQPAGAETPHKGVGRCRDHGGNTASHMQAARLQMAQEAAQAFGGRRDVHPAEALLELVQTKAQEVEFWRMLVSRLEEGEMTWGVSKVEEGVTVGFEDGSPIVGDKVTKEAKPHVFLVQLREAERDLANYAKASISAGAEQSLVAFAQLQASRVFGAMQRLVSDSRVVISGDRDAVLRDALRGWGNAGS